MSRYKTIGIFDPYASMDYFYKNSPDDVRFFAFITPLEMSQKELAQRLNKTYFKDIFYLTHDYQKDLEIVKKAVSQHKIDILLSGFEGNLVYNEKLMHAINPDFYNDPNTSLSRSDKYHMQQALMKHDLPHIQSILITNIEQGINEIKNLSYPAVIKPNIGTGASVGVTICNNKDEAENAIKKTLGGRGALGVNIKELLAQEFISGDEYVVDGIVITSKIEFAGVFKYVKTIIDNNPIYRYIDVLESNSKMKKKLIDFTIKAYHALDVKTSFVHFEFMSNSVMKLIELNPRLSGIYGFLNHAAKISYGHDQVTLLHGISDATKIYEHCRIFCLENFGFPSSTIDTTQIELLQSLQTYKILNPVNEKGNMPKNLEDIAVLILLATNNLTQLDEDTNTLSNLEKTGKIFHE